MARFWIRASAPFAAFRGMQAGVYRATAPTMPYSAAWGLVLNLAGIDMRAPDVGPTTLISEDLPRMRLAIGATRPSDVGTLYQQLHSYPVGSSGKEFKDRTHGAKYWIAPVRREVLVGLEVVIGIDSIDDAMAESVECGLRGGGDMPRYGLPFAGDNSFLFDRLELVDRPAATSWYAELKPDEPPRRGSCRLTVGIDRADSSRTTCALVAPTEPMAEPPPAAWIWTPRPPE